jgi:hypothetical protein
MISQSSWLYPKSGIAAVENSRKIEVESACASLARPPVLVFVNDDVSQLFIIYNNLLKMIG